MESLLTLLSDFFVQPLEFEFMRRALIVSIMVGVVCAVFSCFLVVKGWSLMGDAVAHAVLPGLAIAYIAGLPLAIGAFAAGLLCAVATGYIKDNSRVKEDAVMGILFSGMFAFGLVLLTKIETDIHLLHVLFGNVLGVSWDDIANIAIITFPLIAVMLIKWKDLMVYCFDPNHAQAAGLPVNILHYGLLIFLALTIVASLKAAGIILVIAMLIAPGAIGFMLANRFGRMLSIAISVSVGCSVLGTLASFHWDVATAPLIVLMQAGVFALAILFSPRQGLLMNIRKQNA